MEIGPQGVVGRLAPLVEAKKTLVVNFRPVSFILGPNRHSIVEAARGVIPFFPAEKKVYRQVHGYPTVLSAAIAGTIPPEMKHLVELSLRENGRVLFEFQPNETMSSLHQDLSAFSHMVFLEREGKLVLFVHSVQKLVEKVNSTSLNRLVPRDAHQEVHGPMRHYLFFDVALKLAGLLNEAGVPTEVHTVHPDSVPDYHSEGEKKPFRLLSRQFETSSISFGKPEIYRIQTINLSRPLQK